MKNDNSKYPVPFRKHQQGLTLIELMVAITISLVLLAGVVEIFWNTKQTYKVQQAVARLQENGRFANIFLTRDIREAGFLGCINADNITPNIIAANPTPVFDSDSVINAYEAKTATTWEPVLPTALTTGATTAGISVKGGTDVITVKTGGDCGANLQKRHTGDESEIKIDAPNSCDIKQNDTLIISDCSKAHIFRVTSISGGASSGKEELKFSTAGNSTDKINATYDIEDSRVYKLVETTYFIGDDGDGNFSLWRQVGTTTPQEVIEGIEDMEIEYGEDSDGNRTANRYVDANESTMNIKDIVSVRIHLLARTLTDNIALGIQTLRFKDADFTPSPADKRIRRTFTSTINLRNRTP